MLAVLVRGALDSSSVRDGDLRHQGVLHWCLLMLATLSKYLVASCVLVASFDASRHDSADLVLFRGWRLLAVRDRTVTLIRHSSHILVREGEHLRQQIVLVEIF